MEEVLDEEEGLMKRKGVAISVGSSHLKKSILPFEGGEKGVVVEYGATEKVV